jgi:riboflavin kinase/FMN adenylyltransferase
VLRWTNLSQIPAGFGPSVVTLGNFDGVHRGHRAVLGAVVEQARAIGAHAAAVTFEPHPVAVLHPERAPQIITDPGHRLALLEATGLDAVLVMEFTRELASWTPEHFVRSVFVEALGARVVVVGKDTRFGVRNSGDVGTLRELGREHGFEVLTLDDLGGETRWSSSRVRQLVAAGEVGAAAEILGRPHRVSGTVVHGDHRGRELGYPTANLGPVSAGLVPADGVYAGWLLRPGLSPDDPDHTMPAAVSIGTNPTFDGTQRRVEAYVLDRTDLDLYGEGVVLELVERLRPTERYDTVEALVSQMAQDVESCRRVLSSIVPS